MSDDTVKLFEDELQVRPVEKLEQDAEWRVPLSNEERDAFVEVVKALRWEAEVHHGKSAIDALARLDALSFPPRRLIT